jgi:hypothetical protein
MEVLIVFLIIAIMAVMFWSTSVSRQLSIAVFSVIFLGIAIAMLAWQGFTQEAFGNIGLSALVLFLVWLRFSKSIADTARAREQLKVNLSRGRHSACEVCGIKKLTYHRKPKNMSQLLIGGFTCEKCGTELDVTLDMLTQR